MASPNCSDGIALAGSDMNHIEENSQDKQINDVVVGDTLTLFLGTPVDGQEVPERRGAKSAGFFRLRRKDRASSEVEDLGIVEESSKGQASHSPKGSSRLKTALLPSAGVAIVALLVLGAQLKGENESPSISSDIAQLAQPSSSSLVKGQREPEAQADEPGKVVPDSVLDRLTANRPTLENSGADKAQSAPSQGSSTELPEGLAKPPAGNSEALAVAISRAGAVKGESSSKTPSQTPQPAVTQSPVSAAIVDKNSSSMDVPLTADHGTSADIASLKQSSGAGTAPSAKLATPVEEVRAPEKTASKTPQKPEAKPSPKEAASTPTDSPKLATAPTKEAQAKQVDPKAQATAKLEKHKHEVKANLQEASQEKAKPKLVRNVRDDDEFTGYALPIREVYANGRPVSQATSTPVAKAPERPAEQRQNISRSGGAVEVVHVELNYALVTNPNSQLPMRVSVGGTLPNGAVVKSFDVARGVIITNRGSYGMN